MTTPEGGQPPASEGTQVTDVNPGSPSVTTPSSMVIDGRKVVFESDLIASKRSSEERYKQAVEIHATAIDRLQLDNSNSLQQVSELSDKLNKSIQARETGAVSSEDVAKAIQDLEAAKADLTTSQTQQLELKRANIVLASKGAVQAEHIAEKDMAQLVAFEDALKVVSQSISGAGNYASGAGSGSATPETRMERARRALDSVGIRGVPNTQVNNSS